MFTCPYCGRRTTVFGSSDIDSIAYGRAKCDHCAQEYMIVNDVPMTEKEYQEISLKTSELTLRCKKLHAEQDPNKRRELTEESFAYCLPQMCTGHSICLPSIR
jgi:hypothetical protein